MEGGIQLLASVILWGDFISEEGALEEEGESSMGRTFTCYIEITSLLEGGYSSVLDYCGGVSRS
jgi:hypothetical protein